jgi:hypothetical protein
MSPILMVWLSSNPGLNFISQPNVGICKALIHTLESVVHRIDSLSVSHVFQFLEPSHLARHEGCAKSYVEIMLQASRLA